MAPRYLGEFEQMVLLAILQLKEGAFALSILGELDERAGRSAARGTLYKTLERLEAKGFLRWAAEDGSPERGGHPRRCFTVTGREVAASYLPARRAASFDPVEVLKGEELGNRLGATFPGRPVIKG